jgi:hypothetical protein
MLPPSVSNCGSILLILSLCSLRLTEASRRLTETKFCAKSRRRLVLRDNGQLVPVEDSLFRSNILFLALSA